MSANPFMPKVSANDSNVEICSSKTLTSPEYMNVNRATIEPNVAPGITITGWNGASSVLNNSEKNELHALKTTRCARTVRPSADKVTSVKCDWSNSNGNDVNRLVFRRNEKKWKKKREFQDENLIIEQMDVHVHDSLQILLFSKLCKLNWDIFRHKPYDSIKFPTNLIRMT